MEIRLDAGSLNQAFITWLTITGPSRKGAQVLSRNHPAMKSHETRRSLSTLKPTCGMRRYGWRHRLVRARYSMLLVLEIIVPIAVVLALIYLIADRTFSAPRY